MTTTTIVNGIVLAAGLGTRLRPITGTIPKPMVPVCNRPLLGNILINLNASGVDKIAVNTHYLADKVNEYIVDSSFSDYVELFHEDEILGTGGPLINAKKLLCEHENFILHNGDILTDLDVQSLINCHVSNGNAVTMMMIDGPENKVRVNQNGTVVDIIGKLGADESIGQLFTYAGISVYSQEIFEHLPQIPQNCSIITAIVDLMKAKPGSVGTFIPEEIYWNDLGTIKQYYQAHQDILKYSRISLPQINLPACQPDVSSSNTFSGFNCLSKNSSVSPYASVTDCILLDGAIVKAGAYHRKEIIGPDYTIHADIEILKNISIVPDLDSYQVSSLVEQGSDRQFYRLTKDDDSKVLMISHKDDLDFNRFLEIGEFIESIGVPIPTIYDCDYENFAVLMEDMGRFTLYDLVSDSTDVAYIESLYKRVIEQSVSLHDLATFLTDKNIGPTIRTFDYDYLRWETNYFSVNFLKNYCGIDQNIIDEFDQLFELLARDVLAQRQVFMHRDFQSQNIVIKNDKIGFVDFQGARIGGIGYDAMSLINDPYVELSKELRDRMKKYYLQTLNAHDFDISADEFRCATITAGLQRSMQALGAYTFLSMQKGKTAYLKYISRCLDYLIEGVQELQSLDSHPRVVSFLNLLITIKTEHGKK